MIPTQGKMTPPATLLMKSPLHSDGHTSTATHLLSCSGSGQEWAGRGAAGRQGGREAPPPCWGVQGGSGAAQIWAPSFPQPTLQNEPDLVFKLSL